MNKKFSTLMAGLVLVSSFPVVAQTHSPIGVWGQNGEIPYRTQNTADIAGFLGGDGENLQGVRTDVFDYSTGNDGKYNDLKVQQIDGGKWYQLEVANSSTSTPYVLVQLRDYKTGRLYLKSTPMAALRAQYSTNGAGPGPNVNNPTLNSSLWQIEVISREPGSFMYRFKNKETGYYLTYNCADANAVELSNLNSNAYLTSGMVNTATDTIKSDVSSWRWYTTDRKTDAYFGTAKLYTFNHTKEKVIGLALNNKSEVVLVDIPYEKLNSTNDEQMVANYNILSVTVRNAGAHVLTANDINSMIDADGSWMNSVKGYPQRDSVYFKNAIGDLTSGGYKAINTAIQNYRNRDFATSKYAGYSIILRKGDNKYFGVEQDETYENDKNPTEHGGLVVRDIELAYNPALGSMNAVKARFHWKVTYYPTPDSLVFEPLNASYIGTEDKKAGKKWADTPLASVTNPEYFYNTINKATAHTNGTASGTTSVPFDKPAYVPVALTAMNNTGEIDNKSVLTVGQSRNTATGLESLAKNKYGRPVSTDNVANMGIKIQFDNNYTYLQRATLDNGLYFIKVKVDAANKTDYRKDGMNLVYNMWGQLMYDNKDDHQNYEHMPATQWVIEQDSCEIGFDQTPYVTIRNREYGSEGSYAFHGQLYQAGDYYYFINHQDYNVAANNTGKFPVNFFSCGDTLKFEKITKTEITENGKLGYKNFAQEPLGYETWGIKYSTANTYNGLNSDRYLSIDEKDSYLAVEDNQWNDFEVSVLKDDNFGYAGEKTGLAPLSRTVYTLKVRDNNLIDNNWRYVVVKEDENGNPYYQMAHLKDVDGKNVKLGTFYFKADQLDANGDTAYVFVDATGWTTTADFKKERWAETDSVLNLVNTYDYALYPGRQYVGNGFRQMGIKSQTAKATYVTLDTDPETVNSAFTFVKTDRPLYMPIGLDITGGKMNTGINIYRKRGNAGIGQATEHLFEDGNNQSNVAPGSYFTNLSYLGITAEGVKPVGDKSTTALYVDTVYSSKARMPQYLFMVDVKEVGDGRWCDTNQHGYFPSEEAANTEDATHHIFYNGYVAGRVLVNFNDSIAKQTSINMLDEAKKYAFRNYSRLGFVEGIHMFISEEGAHTAFDQPAGEYLFILKGGLKLADLTTEVGNYPVIDAKKFNDAFAAGLIDANPLNGEHQNYAFSLRYTDDEHQDVLLESQNMDKEGSVGTFSGASWVQIMDGVPVLAQNKNINGDHTSIDGNSTLSQLVAQAQIFNLNSTDETATSNDEISTSTVTVVAGKGTITIKNAAGKSVTVGNVLGQTIASQTISSDDVTISAPAGVVVVSVEGETAVKAIVK